MAGFDLSALLGDVSQFGHERKQIEYIPLSNIVSDERNRYELSGIEELAANIEMFGLQQPLEVRPSDTQAGVYIVTSGHRRKAALELLGEEEVPCIVVEAMASEALQELRLIFANSDTRRMSPAEQAWQAERIEQLLYELKEQGYDFPGRMRDHVASITKMSKSKLARLSVIRKNLKPGSLLDAFNSGDLNESAAYEIARCSEEAQELAEEQMPLLCKFTADEIERLMFKLEKEVEADKRIVQKVQEDLAKLPAAKAEPDENARARTMKYLEERQREDLEYFNLLTEHIEVFLSRIPLSINRKERIDEFKLQFKNSGGGSSDFNYDGYSNNGLSVGSFERAVPKITRTWTEAYDLFCAAAVARLKRELQASACPNSDTERKWSSGLPEHDCFVAGRFDCGGNVIKSVVRYSAENKRFYFDSSGLPLDVECVGWVELPED